MSDKTVRHHKDNGFRASAIPADMLRSDPHFVMVTGQDQHDDVGAGAEQSPE